MTVEELLTRARVRLAQAPSRPSGREANLLLARVLGWGEASVLGRGDTPIPDAARRRFEDLLQRRLTGEPVAYLLGEKEFFGRTFAVDSRVLIPRPETEHLIEAALELPLPRTSRVLELGTGSGCLAVSLACELPDASIVATDVSVAALAVAEANRRRHAVERQVTLLAADLATSLTLRSFDVLISNPPYVDPADATHLAPDIVDFEPPEAVFAPDVGHSVLSRIIDLAASLESGSILLMEIGAGQAPIAERLVRSSPLQLLELRSDLAGIPRVVIARRR